jgi:hypothetical protein
MRRIAIIVSFLCALALAAGVADAAHQALAVVADDTLLLPADQTTDDGSDRFLFLVPALSAAVPAQGSLILAPAPQAAWQAGPRAVWDLARAPPLVSRGTASCSHRKPVMPTER